jgi:transposase
MKGAGGGAAGALATGGARRATGVASASAVEPGARRPDPEVPAKAQRRRFTAEYKLRIIEEADACREPGEIGALLRREGLYTSHLSIWREQRRAGALTVMAQPRGRKAKQSPVEKRLVHVERENARLREELRQAHVIIAVQKKLSGLLGIPPADANDEQP